MGKAIEILLKVRARLSWQRDAALIAGAGLFDPDYYLDENPDVASAGVAPVEHYLKVGAFEGRDPHPLFCSSYYLAENPKVGRWRINPLLHYIRVGDAQGRWPNPFFDPKFYRGNFGRSIAPGVTTLRDYVERGDRLSPTCDGESDAEFPVITPEKIERAGGWLSAALSEWRRGVPYGDWIERFDVVDEETLRALGEIYREVDGDPLFRFAFIDGGAPQGLYRTVDSLRRQLYGRWEVFVPGESESKKLLSDFVGDSRIRFSRSVPDILAQPPDGTCPVFVGVLECGAILRPHYLSLVGAALRSKREAALVYADEDVVLESGKRRSPRLKPDWDPVLALQCDLVGSAGVFAADRLRSVAPKAPERSSIQEICALAQKGLDRRDTVHIPRVLVHLPPTSKKASWRRLQYDESSPRDVDLEAIAREIGGSPTQWNSEPKVSIIVPTRDRPELLKACVESVILNTDSGTYEILVIDNGSTEAAAIQYLEELKRYPHIRVLSAPGEFNFSALNNRAVRECTGELLCFLNNDIEIRKPGWLSVMARFAALPQIGAVGSVLLYDDGTVQHGGVVLGAAGLAAHSFVGEPLSTGGYLDLLRCAREVSAVTAACLVVRRSQFEAVGGFDAEELAVNFNDVDLCLKLGMRGLKNLILPLDGITHHESKSRATQSTSAARLSAMRREASVMHRRWGEAVKRDPFYNENLTHSPFTYQLAAPPRVPPLPRVQRRAESVEWTALGREERLDIYFNHSNEVRVSEVVRSVPPPSIEREVSHGLSVVILNKDAPQFIVPLINQLRGEEERFAAIGLGFEVLIGDTGSVDERTIRAYRDLPPFIKVVDRLEYNFSRCNNLLEERANFGTVLFLNNDIVLPAESGVLVRGYHALKADSTFGVLSAVLDFPNGTIQHMGCDFLSAPRSWGLPYHINSHSLRRSIPIPDSRCYPGVTGAFLMLERELFHRCGRFDVGYRAECQDVALCLEAHRLGFRSACVDLGRIVHIENGTRQKGEEHWGDRRRFLRRYGAYIQGNFL